MIVCLHGWWCNSQKICSLYQLAGVGFLEIKPATSPSNLCDWSCLPDQELGMHITLFDFLTFFPLSAPSAVVLKADRNGVCCPVKASSLNIPQGNNISEKKFSYGILDLWHKHSSRTLRSNRWYLIFLLNFNCKWHFLSREKGHRATVVLLEGFGAWPRIWSGARRLPWMSMAAVTMLQHLSSVPRTSISSTLSLILPPEVQSLTLQNIFFCVFIHCALSFSFFRSSSTWGSCIFICAGAGEVEWLSAHGVSHKTVTEENSVQPLQEPQAGATVSKHMSASFRVFKNQPCKDVQQFSEVFTILRN